jgi:hypothetical protein
VEFPYLRLSIVERIERLAVQAGVSEVARSPRGFLAAYKLASGEAAMLGKNPENLKPWPEVRDKFLRQHLDVVTKKREPLWTKAGQPTRRHLMLMVWAYTPTPERTLEWLRALP